MKVNIKKLDKNAIIPTYAKKGDAGLDITTIGISETTESYIEYKTGLAIEIPETFVGLIFPRSSISKTDLVLANAVGVIDSGYRGEIKCRFKIVGEGDINIYEKGDKIAQLIIIPYPEIELQEVQELSSTERGQGGFGSSGN